MWPIVDETVNTIVHKATEKAHAIKNIFQRGVQKQLGLFNAAVAFKKAKFQKALQSAAQLKHLATAKIKTIAAAKLNHLQQIAALKAQKLQAVTGAAAAITAKPKPLQSNIIKIPPPIILSQQTLPSKTISGDYVHTYDNSLRFHGGKGKNNYADMGVTSFEHFQDTVLRELEEKEERKVEATLHTLYEDEPIIHIASHHSSVHSAAPTFIGDTKINGPQTPIPISDDGWVPMGVPCDPKFPAEGLHNPIFTDQPSSVYTGQISETLTDQSNPFIIDQSNFPSSNAFSEQTNRFRQEGQHNVRPVYEQFNDIIITSPPYLQPFFDNHLASEETSKKSVTIAAPQSQQNRYYPRAETTTDWPGPSPSSISTQYSTNIHHRESINMLPGGSSITGDTTRHRVKMPPRKLKPKIKPTSRTSTSRIRDIETERNTQRYPTTSFDRYFDTTPTPDSHATTQLLKFDTTSTQFKPKITSQTSTTTTSASATATKYGFSTHPKPKPSTPAKFEFPTQTKSKPKPITTIKIDIPTHSRPKMFTTETKLDTAHSNIEPVTTKFETTYHTAHPGSTIMAEKKPRLTTTFRTTGISNSTGTKPTKKLSRGTIKYAASKSL